MSFLLRVQKGAAHTRVRVFGGQNPPGSRANLGELTMRHAEAQDLIGMLGTLHDITVEHEEPRYSFTQPICNGCYTDRYPGRMPGRLVERTMETCCVCGNPTESGIYMRVDPTTVPHPSLVRE